MMRLSSNCAKVCFLACLILYLHLASSQKCAFASANSTEAEALLKWKASFQNLTQNNLTSWSWVNANEAPCDTWIGISCNSAGSVNRINLTNSGIQGTLLEFPFMSLPNLAYFELSYNELSDQIPPEISSLTKLIYFDVSYNQMSGKIPPEIGLLTNLQVLHLNANKFNGSIPQEIGQLKFVYELALNLNNLEGSIPAAVGNLSQLTSLILFGNQLSGPIPPEIGNLSKLVELYLFDNYLSGPIPPSLGNLKNLTLMILYNNTLSGSIPTSLGNLTNLVCLSLYDNKLSGNIPGEIGNLKSVVSLELTNNQLNGTVPSSFGNLSSLESLYLSGNRLSGSIPQDICRGGLLQRFIADNNDFTGPIPKSLKGCKSLVRVLLDHNQLEGPLPLWWSTNVTSLSLQGNLFFGSIPSNIDQMMPNLQQLFLSENNLKGTIPPSVCNMLQLEILSLRSNQFSGELPRAWSVESNMSFLDVGHNNLSGNIPTSLGVLSSLQILKLNNNNFGGEIPDSLKNCSSLESIDLGDNNLFGNVPLMIGRSNVSMMRMLRLRSNYFSGHISQQLCNLRHLHILDLSHNSFSGTIPMCLDNITSLVNNDSDAYSTGFIEQVTLTLKGSELVYNTTLNLVKSIDLSSNNLQGEIPEKICSLILLGTLNLSMNQLTGKIPSKIGNLRWLETLDLSHNHLSGQIPQSLSSLTFLNHLNMSYNNLFGKIPMGNQLQTLHDLSIYMDNPLLCGVPLPTKCHGDDTFPTKDAKDKNEDGNDTLWFYASVVLGFILGFWGVCGTLILKTSWRHAYFQFFNNIKDKQLGVLSLRSNQFYGELPRAWNVGSKLGFLHVGLNNLSGDILTSLGVLSSLLVLKLNNNNFGCEIPNSLQNCSLLMSIDLGDNKLCGNIPLWMYNLEMSWCISYEMYNAAFYSSLFACPKIHTVFAFQEKAFLKKLKFHLNAPTPYVFMLRFLKAARSETKLEHLAFYLIELCLVECEALRFKPSLLCAAALYVARCTLQITPAWTPLLCKHARYEVSQIRDCAEMVLRFHKAARMGSLKVTYEKYSSPDLSSVAAIKPLDTLPLRFSLEG